jgi:tetratricopeptide (TPR) repeat protein
MALEYYLKALELHETHFGEEDPRTINLWMSIARAYSQLDKCDEADWIYYLHRLRGESQREWSNHTNIKSSLEYYLKVAEALEKRQREHGRYAASIPYLWKRIGGFYNSLGFYPSALEFFQKSLGIHEAQSDKDDWHIVDLLRYMARAYKGMGDHIKALETLGKAIEIHESGPNRDDGHIIANLFEDSASVYKEMGDHPKTLGAFQKAFEIRERVCGVKHDMTCWTSENIAEYCREQGDHPRAIEWFRKVIEITEKQCAGRYSQINLILRCEELARFFQELGKYDDALELFQRVMDICQKRSDDVDYDVLESIADIHSARGDSQLAIEWLEKAVECLQKYLRKYAPKKDEIQMFIELHNERKEHLKQLRAKLRRMKKTAQQ